MGRRQAGGDSRTLRATFCWETLSLAVHVDVPLTCTYLSIVADHIHPLIETDSLTAGASFSRLMRPATKK